MKVRTSSAVHLHGEPTPGQATRARCTVAHVATGELSTHELEGRRVTIGRAPESDIVLRDPRIGRRQGAFLWEGEELVYEHLKSEACPSFLRRAECISSVDEGQDFRVALQDGDELLLGHAPGTALVRVEIRDEGAATALADEEQVHLARSIDAAGSEPWHVTRSLGAEALVALQRFAVEAAGARDVGEVVTHFARRLFDACRAANHLAVFLTAQPTGSYEPFMAFDRSHQVAPEPLSRTLATLVRDKGEAFAFHAGDLRIRSSGSLKIARVRAGLCAPLWSGKRTIGMVQLDRRGKLIGDFDESDLELLTIFARQLAVLIDSKATSQKLWLEIVQLRRAQAKMVALAFCDPLTGLPNRRLFLDRLERALARVNRGGSGFALLYADLDGLKQTNDRFGHGIGDLVICTVARRLRVCVREVDTVARLGGDEFAIILDGVDSIDSAMVVVRKIQRQFENPIEIPAGRERGRLHASVSVGIALAPRDGSDAAGLLAKADASMYSSKTAHAAPLG